MQVTTTGFFVVARSVFQHPLFVDEPYSRREAWLWLCGMAAWQPTGRRTRGGIVNLERGELIVTERDLSTIWLWSKSTVRRFLLTLQAEQMVYARKSGPGCGPDNGPNPSYQVTVLTVCNYESFQTPRKTYPQRVDQVADQVADHEKREALAPQLPFESQQLNQYNNMLKKVGLKNGVGKGASRTKPAHGRKGRGMIWLDHGTDEWEIYAKDYQEVTGATILPTSREGGSGNWFVLEGEAARRRLRRA